MFISTPDENVYILNRLLLSPRLINHRLIQTCECLLNRPDDSLNILSVCEYFRPDLINHRLIQTCECSFPHQMKCLHTESIVDSPWFDQSSINPDSRIFIESTRWHVYILNRLLISPWFDQSPINPDLWMLIESIAAEKSFSNPLDLHNGIGPSLVCKHTRIPH